MKRPETPTHQLSLKKDLLITDAVINMIEIIALELVAERSIFVCLFVCLYFSGFFFFLLGFFKKIHNNNNDNNNNNDDDDDDDDEKERKKNVKKLTKKKKGVSWF